MKIDPEIARQRASLAANTRWAKETDRTAATAKMRQAFLDRLEREARDRLGPNASDAQVTASVDNALKAHQAKMRLASLKARRAAADERRTAAAGEILSDGAA